MIEGHRGSVLCLACLAQAFDALPTSQGMANCTMCPRNLPIDMTRWQHAARPRGSNGDATVCQDGIQHAVAPPASAWQSFEFLGVAVTDPLLNGACALAQRLSNVTSDPAIAGKSDDVHGDLLVT